MAIRMMDDLDPLTASELLSEAVRRDLPRHSWLFHEGEPTDDVYLVVSGLLKLMKTGADGSEAVLAIRGAGDVVGELSAIDARPRLASASRVIGGAASSLSRPLGPGTVTADRGVSNVMTGSRTSAQTTVRRGWMLVPTRF